MFGEKISINRFCHEHCITHSIMNILLVIAVLLLIVYVIRRHIFLSQWNHFPGFKGWEALPVVGHSHKLGNKPIYALLEYQKKFGDTFRLDLGHCPTIILAGFEDGSEAFKSEVN